MKYKKGRRFGLPHERQSYIYFRCLNYLNLSEREQQKIRKICSAVGGAYEEALFEAVTTNRRLLDTASDYYISEPLMYRTVKEFYHIANKKM